MTVLRSSSLGRRGEAQWERLRAAFVLSRRRGEIMLVASDSRAVREEVLGRLKALASRVDVIAPGPNVEEEIHKCASARQEGEGIPVVWVEGTTSPESDARWREALVVLNMRRDLLQDHGPCHVVLAGPESLHRFVRARAPDLSSFIAVVLLLDGTLEGLVTHQGTLTWVHLSDLHVQGESWQQDHVLGALVRDMPRLLKERELRPDMLFVTGDVAARGQRVEYDGAFRLLDELSRTLGLERGHEVFVVPGNHDVERGKIGRMVERDRAALLELEPNAFRSAVGELLGDANEFLLYGKRLGEWCSFTETLLGRARSVSMERPWRSDVIDVRGLPVGVLSLCTAWASGPEDRKGGLLLGERQIQELVDEARDGGAQLVIALMHHPLHWLHDGEHSAIRGRLERDVDIVLHGHVHEPHAELHVAAGSARVEIGAGAAYAGMGQDPYHGFSVGRLDLDNERLDVHCFTWSTRRGGWHADSGTPGADEYGRVSVAFSPAAIAPTVRKIGSEVLATRLRHAAAKVYATADFAGLGAGGPRRHVTLEQIFVPLRLAAKGLDSADPSWFEDPSEEEVAFERGDPEEDIPDDAETWRPRYDAPEGAVVDVMMQVSGRVTLKGLDAMLASGRKVVVLGGPGSGKSTLARYLASNIAAREGGSVPLLLTVRDWIAEGKREHLLDMAARQVSTSLSVRTDRTALETLCGGGRVVLIVDGVDEAADAATRRELRSQIHSFVAAYPRVAVLVTSRIAGYHEIPLDDEFEELTLEPFDDEAIGQFVRRWYDLVENDPAVRLRKRVDLMHAFDVEPRAKELARNPLLATLIGMVHFSHAQLPGDRAKLYGLIIELLLVTWPAERRCELPGLHGTMQQPMLESLALRLQEQRAGAKDREDQAEVLIDVEQLGSMLEDLLAEHLREHAAPERRYLARKWGKWLIDDCGLLQEQQPGRVGFLHLSLMEYMAGRALFERTVGGGYDAVAALVRKRHDQTVWRETLLLMLGGENKKRELGQAVVEQLLPTVPAEPTRWSACVFGLALLREEVDMGELRERVLERTCEAALGEWPWQWDNASKQLSDVVRFGRTHGAGTSEWLRAEIKASVGERWVGAVGLAGSAVGKKEIVAWIEERRDRPAAVLALLDFGPRHFAGWWAREHCSRELALAWARSTPLEGILWRSFEGFEEGVEAPWIPGFFTRAVWMVQGVAALGEEALRCSTDVVRSTLPGGIAWYLGQDVYGAACFSFPIVGSRPVDLTMGFAHGFIRHFAERHAKDFAIHLMEDRVSAPDGLADDLARFFAQVFSLGGPRLEDAASGTDWLSDAIAQRFVRSYSEDLIVQFRYGFIQTFDPQFLRTFEKGVLADLNTKTNAGAIERGLSRTFWERLSGASSQDDINRLLARIVVMIAAEVHAALFICRLLNDRQMAPILATLRIQNRWLNLYFTPLVEYATRTRPLPEHPDLHALLLTYGLVQYQTTWEWPDCPHWRSWFASDPPEHWLPAHVWHLVRSIQDPTNPIHRALADAALDRNDWPELAQALRETTLVPTPPEILALFDHGNPNDDLPPSTPT